MDVAAVRAWLVARLRLNTDLGANLVEYVLLITLIALGGSGIITADTLKLFALGLPALVVGTWSWTGDDVEVSLRRVPGEVEEERSRLRDWLAGD